MKLQKFLFVSIFRRASYLKLQSCFSSKHGVVIESRDYESVVGLEVHAQINANSKLFSSTAAVFGGPTNTNVSYFDAALPGTLPVLNNRCVEAGVLTAFALNCKVNKVSKFDRKHYFYPDLPSGYQITQQFEPLAVDGSISYVVHDDESGCYECKCLLKQLQLEQDSGRSLHLEKKSFVDLNRAGIGLIELVFEPNLKNGAEAAALVRELILILKRLDTCTCEMEKGTLRVDANISVNKPGDPFGVRTEVKNINSIRFIARAIDFEINRQIDVLQKGELVINETRGYDYSSKATVFMRDKERLQDYRFMPEPNIPPIVLYDSNDENTKNQTNIDEIRNKMPVLPDSERLKLMKEYKLSLEEADDIVNLDGFGELFEEIYLNVPKTEVVCEFLLRIFQHHLHARNIVFKESELTVAALSNIVQLLSAKTISIATANDILEMLLNGDDRPPTTIVENYNWYQISDHKELEKLCSEILPKYSKVAKRYKRSQKKRDMSTLLIALNEKVNNRASIPDAEEVFKKLIWKQGT